MNDNGWDDAVNENTLTEEERRNRNARIWREDYEQRQTNWEERRLSNSVEIPGLDENSLNESFPFYVDQNPEHILAYSSWRANRSIWICHHCGSMGWKQDNEMVRELFKCYACRSRNVQCLKAGDISKTIRRHPELGFNMQDIFSRRKERMKEERLRRRGNAQT